MAFLIDTNVVSETFRPRPAPRVLEWVRRQMASDLFLAAMSLGELVRGARGVKDRVQRERLARWINHDLATQFQGRILPFDREAAVIWGTIMGEGLFSCSCLLGPRPSWPRCGLEARTLGTHPTEDPRNNIHHTSQEGVQEAKIRP